MSAGELEPRRGDPRETLSPDPYRASCSDARVNTGIHTCPSLHRKEGQKKVESKSDTPPSLSWGASRHTEDFPIMHLDTGGLSQTAPETWERVLGVGMVHGGLKP